MKFIVAFVLALFSVQASALTFKSGQSLSSSETGEKIDNGVQFSKGPLEQLSLPDTWPFDFNTPLVNFNNSKSYMIDSADDERAEKCVTLLSNWREDDQQHQRDRDGDMCIYHLGAHFYKSGNLDLIERLLLSWAKKGKPTYTIKENDVWCHDHEESPVFVMQVNE